ncbi:hypothetical protein CYMTET_13662 [Cymbomonas tetramitiformis]|uniref:RING-type domain-containing protein n=1 Tax=Cymbomonas tetramitiformis TaxID=36881 RepID=A0AAE0GHM7_9CHLO|nr:hypothetical protein CYMTET_13662 [Cymbomonas tetramitiformis]
MNSLKIEVKTELSSEFQGETCPKRPGPSHSYARPRVFPVPNFEELTSRLEQAKDNLSSYGTFPLGQPLPHDLFEALLEVIYLETELGLRSSENSKGESSEGLRPRELRALPRYRVTAAGRIVAEGHLPRIEGGERATEYITCSQCNVCLCDYTAGDALVRLPCAGKHFFHRRCIGPWFEHRTSCPVCREDISGYADENLDPLMPLTDRSSLRIVAAGQSPPNSTSTRKCTSA